MSSKFGLTMSFASGLSHLRQPSALKRFFLLQVQGLDVRLVENGTEAIGGHGRLLHHAFHARDFLVARFVLRAIEQVQDQILPARQHLVFTFLGHAVPHEHAAGDIEEEERLGFIFLRFVMLTARQEEDHRQEAVNAGAQKAQEHGPQRMHRFGVLQVHHADVKECHRHQRDEDDQPAETNAREDLEGTQDDRQRQIENRDEADNPQADDRRQ